MARQGLAPAYGLMMATRTSIWLVTAAPMPAALLFEGMTVTS
jgi:hypothetical protein